MSHESVRSGESGSECEVNHVSHVSHSVGKYKALFFGLMALTLVTVGLSYVDFGSSFWNIVVALVVASAKAGLVAAIFMHLWGERATIWKVLVFTGVFVVGLFVLSYLHFSDPIMKTAHSSRSSKDLWGSSTNH